MNFQNNFRTLNRLIWSMVLISTVAMLVSRTIFFFNVIDWSQLTGREVDVWRAFFIGSRFDIKIMAIAYAPLFLLGLLIASFDNWFKKWLAFSYFYNWVITVLVVGFSIGNYYYYVTYGTYMDMFVFGLFDDDTKAVLINIWEDYPVIWVLLALVVLSTLLNKVYGSILSRVGRWQYRSNHWLKTTAMVMIVITIYFGFARGSFGTFPLRRLHANVSDYVVLNMVTPNPFIALSWASSDYKRQAKLAPVTDQEYRQIMTEYLGQPTPVYSTPENTYLAQKKPNVVVALMESMGTNVLLEDKMPENDLLGALRQPFEEDFVYKRFVAETTGTINSLVAMLFYSSTATISHAEYQRTKLPLSAIKPYQDNGYETTFIMSANGMWRNLANYMPLQGFDRFIDENLLMREYPDSASYNGVWGVPDEFAFKYAQKILDESDKPQLIYILSATNHPPFEVPKHYKAKPFKESERLHKLTGPLAATNPLMLQTYQYANNALGEFIAHVKASRYGENTVIAATGDHRMRYLDANQAEDFSMTHGVPFYLHVPKPILDQVDYQYDPMRIGSHRDVFPTLFQFTLSDTDYISLGGENLLSPEGVANVGIHRARVITEQGGFDLSRKSVLYPWLDDNFHNSSVTEENLHSDAADSYIKLQKVFTRWQVQHGSS